MNDINKINVIRDINMDDIIRTTNLNKEFGKTKALSDLSITISKNSITGLIGRNGSGKTTLMKILAGILDKSSGEVKVFLEDPMDNISVLNNLVYTYHNMSYIKSIKLHTILYSYKTMFPSFDVNFATKLMKYFELNEKMKYISLSQGMGSIFNFICALSCRAPLTMLDEPVLGMDAAVRKSAYEILLHDYSEYPRTFIISSHLLSELEVILSDIILIEQGRLILNSPIDNVRQSAYRVDGDLALLKRFISDKNIIIQKSSSLSNYAVIYEPVTDIVIADAKANNLIISSVRIEDLCIYLTKQNKEEELACLW